MNIRLTQLDGALPNLALMRLSAWHRAQGDAIFFTRAPERRHRKVDPFRHVAREFGEPEYGRVYGSSIFKFSGPVLRYFRREFPEAIVGGTGTDSPAQVEETVDRDFVGLDYSIYPDFSASIGFTQRGCRLSCKFCVVPAKEGKPKSVATIADIWRGELWPKKLHLLDNDFFGQPRKEWQSRLREIRAGDFRICLSQGINARLIDDDAAAALASIEYRDTKFKERRLYTAWDNLRDEEVFFDGVDRLERAGIPPRHLMAYMLVGFDPSETWERIWHRFRRMTERGIEPYPMVYDRGRADLLCFQRWVVTGLYRVKGAAWPIYRRSTKTAESVAGYEAIYGTALRLGGE